MKADSEESYLFEIGEFAEQEMEGTEIHVTPNAPMKGEVLKWGSISASQPIIVATCVS